MAQQQRIWLASMRMWVSSLAPFSAIRIQCCWSCGVGCRRGLDPMLLWLWCRLTAATLIWSLETSICHKCGPKMQKKKKKKKVLKEGRKKGSERNTATMAKFKLWASYHQMWSWEKVVTIVRTMQVPLLPLYVTRVCPVTDLMSLRCFNLSRSICGSLSIDFVPVEEVLFLWFWND